MRCPKCGYITFDYISSCSKCKTSFKNVTGEFQGTSINVTPPSLLGSVTKNNPPIGEVSVDEMLEGHDFDLSIEDTQHDISSDVNNTGGLNHNSPVSASGLDDLEFDEMPSLEESLTPIEDDDEIPTLIPVSDETDNVDTNPRLERLASDLSEIDLSDLVSSSGTSNNEDDIPSLYSIDSEADEIPTLEPLVEDELSDITSFSQSETSHDDNVSSDEIDLQDLDLPSDLDLDDDISTLLDDTNLDDFNLDSDSSNELDVKADLRDGSSLADFFEEKTMIEPLDEPLLDSLAPIAPQFDEMSSFFEEPSQDVDQPAEEDDMFSLQDFDRGESQNTQIADSQTDNFDLSFHDAIENQSVSQSSQNEPIELTLELENEIGTPLKTQPKSTSAPSIPDLGLKLESDSD